MKSIFSIFIFSLLFSCAVDKKTKATAVHSGQEKRAGISCLQGKEWVHSHEEDTKDLMVFRTSDYDFPLSRSRRRYELLSENEVLITKPGKNDLPVKIKGTWLIRNEGNKKYLVVDSRSDGKMELEIESCSEDKLTIIK